MSDPLFVSAQEHGLVRVFTTDLEPEGDAAITARNVERLLGDGISLDPTKVQVFPAKMIESMGMTTYLKEGYGISDSELAGTAAALDAQTGLVAIVPTSAFKGKEVQLDPNPSLRLIGLFHEEKAAPPERMDRTASADGVVPPPRKPSAMQPVGRRNNSWAIVLGALIVAAGLVLLLVF